MNTSNSNTKDLQSLVQVGPYQVPFFLYCSYQMSSQTTELFSFEGQGKILDFISIWYEDHALTNPSAWVNGECGGELLPEIADLLFRPVYSDGLKLEGVIPFTRLHYLRWRRFPPSEAAFDPENPVTRMEFLRLYYSRHLSDQPYPFCKMEQEWLSTWVPAKLAHETLMMPLGIKNQFIDRHLIIHERADVFFHLQGFFAKSYYLINPWLPVYSEFFNAHHLVGDRSADSITPSTIGRTPCIEVPTRSDGVTVLGFPKSEFGIGEATRSVLLALQASGIQSEALDLHQKSFAHPAQETLVDAYISPVAHYRAAILTATLQYPTVLLNSGFQPKFFEDRYFIGSCYWELDRWASSMEFCFRFFDEIWAPTRFIETAFSGPGRPPVTFMPNPIFLQEFNSNLGLESYGLSKESFLFFSMFDANSMVERKNPIGAVKAFKRAFAQGENVKFVIKAMYTSQDNPHWQAFLNEVKDDPRFVVLTSVLNRFELLSLMNQMDAFVSLHRSEGFGLALAESMLLGKPVIATDYSGNVDFCGKAFSFPVSYKLKALQPGEYPYADGMSWADPDLDHAAEQMKIVYQGGDRVEKVVEAAKANIETEYSLKACGLRYRRRLQELGFI